MLDKFGLISAWDTSAITDFSDVFRGKATFNDDISLWDVSSGRKFDSMFRDARVFDQNLGWWDMTSATSVSEMFLNANEFRGEGLKFWDLSLVKTAYRMLESTNLYPGINLIGFFRDGQVSNIEQMFRSLRSPYYEGYMISHWNVTKVEYNNNVFEGTNLTFDGSRGICAAWVWKPHSAFPAGLNGEAYFEDLCDSVGYTVAPTMAPTPTPPKTDDGMSTGAIVGIALGAVAVVSGVVLAVYKGCLGSNVLGSYQTNLL